MSIDSSPAPAVRALCHGLFDYAGLFPPAKLSIGDAVQAYAQHRHRDESWMLGRFVLPATALSSFVEQAAPLTATAPWALSVIVSDWAEQTDLLETFHRTHSDRFPIAAIETRAAVREPNLSFDPVVYVELSVEPNAVQDGTARLPLSGDERAKLRAGGLQAEQFPTAQHVAAFLAACSREQRRFKATAGLHHPFPGSRPTCGDADAAVANMHGFVHLTLAAAILLEDANAEHEAESLLAETDPQAVTLETDQIRWRDRVWPVARLQHVRETFFDGIGSCSFDEPIDDLREIGWL